MKITKTLLGLFAVLLLLESRGQDSLKFKQLKSTGPGYIPEIELSLDPEKMRKIERPLELKIKYKRDTLVGISAANFKEKFKDFVIENAYYIMVRSQTALEFIQNEYLYYATISTYIDDGFAVDFYGQEGAKIFTEAYKNRDNLFKLKQDKMLMIMYFGFSLSETTIYEITEGKDSVTVYFHDGLRLARKKPEDLPNVTYWEIDKTTKPLIFYYCPMQVDRVNGNPVKGTERINCDLGRKVIFAGRISN